MGKITINMENVERKAQGFGNVLCQLKPTRIPRQDLRARLESALNF